MTTALTGGGTTVSQGMSAMSAQVQAFSSGRVTFSASKPASWKVW